MSDDKITRAGDKNGESSVKILEHMCSRHTEEERAQGKVEHDLALLRR